MGVTCSWPTRKLPLAFHPTANRVLALLPNWRVISFKVHDPIHKTFMLSLREPIIIAVGKGIMFNYRIHSAKMLKWKCLACQGLVRLYTQIHGFWKFECDGPILHKKLQLRRGIKLIPPRNDFKSHYESSRLSFKHNAYGILSYLILHFELIQF